MDEKLSKLYNTYQRVTSILSEKPFRYRRNFDDFEKNEPEKYASLVKVAKILNDLPGVSPDKYFEAPYKIFPSEFNGSIIGIDFYCKPRAIRAYTNYMTSNMTTDENLMSESARNKVLSGWRHVVSVCKDMNIGLLSYFYDQNSIPMFINDLNRGLINKWLLSGLRLCGYDFNSCIIFDMYPEAEFMFGCRDINGALDDMLSKLSEREIRWLTAVTQKIKNLIRQQKNVDYQCEN